MNPGTRFTHVIFLDITTYDCSRITPSRISFWTVNFSLILFEWGSVPTNYAFTNRTLFKLLSLFNQNVNSSLDSNLALGHAHGGSKYLSHLGHGVMFACFCKLSVMSTSDFKHVTHILEAFDTMVIPHLQHETVLRTAKIPAAWTIVDKHSILA